MLSSSEKKILSMSIHSLRRRICRSRGCDVESEPYGDLYFDIIDHFHFVTSKIKKDRQRRLTRLNDNNLNLSIPEE